MFDYTYNIVNVDYSVEKSIYDIFYTIALQTQSKHDNFTFVDYKDGTFLKTKENCLPLADFAESTEGLIANVITMCNTIQQENNLTCTDAEKNSMIFASTTEEDIFRLIIEKHYNSNGTIYANFELHSFIDKNELLKKLGVVITYSSANNKNYLAIIKNGKTLCNCYYKKIFGTETEYNYWLFRIIEALKISTYDNTCDFV